MPNSYKKVNDEMKIYLSTEQKNLVKRMASLSNKSLSEYVRDAALSPTLDSAKVEFYQNINENFIEIKKTQFVLTRLLLLLGTEVLKSEDDAINFYKEMVMQAEKEYRK